MKVLSANLSSWQVIFALMLCNRKSLRNLPASGQGLTVIQVSCSQQVHGKKHRAKVYFKLSAKTLLLGRICVTAFSPDSLKAAG